MNMFHLIVFMFPKISKVSKKHVHILQIVARWLLGDFFYSTSFATLDINQIKTSKKFKTKDYVPPEDDGEPKISSLHSRDVYCFARCISKIFDAKKKYDATADWIARLLSDVSTREWISAALAWPDNRPKSEALQICDLFQQDTFVRVMLFFDDLRIKKSPEKDVFFK